MAYYILVSVYYLKSHELVSCLFPQQEIIVFMGDVKVSFPPLALEGLFDKFSMENAGFLWGTDLY